MDVETEPVCNISDVDDATEMTIDHHLDQGERKHVCDLCYRAFSVKKYLKRHLRTHDPKGNNFACDVCKKIYSRKDALKRHLLTHTEERPHACYMCNEAFSRKDELSKHIRIHTSISAGNLYTCYKCYKAFAREDSLKRHLLIHSGNKLHQCTQCDKRFSRKDELIKHSNTHRDPKDKSEKQESDDNFVRVGKPTRKLIIHIRTREPLKVASPTVKVKSEPDP